MRNVFSLVLFTFTFFISSFAQNEDPVLFAIDGNPVNVSEFLYIYQKNNGTKADFSKKNLEEYLDLYTKFKLKVTKAREMKLDTIPELINELAGYRKQLSKSYLVDKEVNEKLIKEVFSRKQEDLSVSHILILSKNEADIEKESIAKAKISFIHNQLGKGVSFKELAEEHSEDKSSAMNGGHLGYVTAMLPNGFYNFENEAYNLKVGSYSKPFRTDYGYHIVKLNAKRPARGELEAAHILIKRNKNETEDQAKKLIDSLYQQLLTGENFEALASKYSRDKKTSIKGGYIGVFGINRYELIFENSAFALKNDGYFTKPFKSLAGWHIVKRISKPSNNNFDKTKRKIGAEITKDKRFEIAKRTLVKRIKKDANFQEDTSALNYFSSLLDPGFFSLYWKVPSGLMQTVFSLGNKNHSLNDFANYCKKNQRKRVRYTKETDIKTVVNTLYKEFIDESCMLYEEEKLEDKYPDFKSLMREYDEGILLFEATKREVWDKASQDTSGLEAFYNKNKGNYLWRSRADLYNYTIHTDDEALVESIHAFAAKKGHEKLITKFNKDNQIITFSRNKVEIGNKELVGLEWKKGAVSQIQMDEEKGVSNFKKIASIMPKSPKSLKEARGYVIADYQEFLEHNWVESLKKEFEVKVDRKVFNKLIKK